MLRRLPAAGSGQNAAWGFDEFIRRPRHLCTVTHKAKVSQPGLLRWPPHVGVSLIFGFHLKHAVASQPGTHLKKYSWGGEKKQTNTHTKKKKT